LFTLIVAASAEFERVVRQLPADSWDRPTPSTFSVRELVQHVVVGNRFTALLLAGVDRDEARTLLAGDQVGNDRLRPSPTRHEAKRTRSPRHRRRGLFQARTATSPLLPTCGSVWSTS